MRALCQSLLSVFAFTLTLAVQAQTYTPKAVRIDAPAGADTAEPLRIAALKPGSLTKEEIEAGLQRLADTGMYSDLRYTVNSTELVIKLTPAASSQMLPVRYGNFVWWQPAELEALIEAKVPIFKGTLPVTGTLTLQVEAALVELMKQKGIDAKVDAIEGTSRPGGPVDSTILTLTRPQVMVGEVTLLGALPELKQPLEKMSNRLRGEEYDTVATSLSIEETVTDIYQNAGYLDVATTVPLYGAPQRDMDRYRVDLTATVQANAMYRVSALKVQAMAPVSEAELLKVAAIKVGDPASPAALRLAKGEMERAYGDRGYLDAKAAVETQKDSEAHTVAYRAMMTAGEVYHVGAVDVSALTPEQQAVFAKNFHLMPGTVPDQNFRSALYRARAELHMAKMPGVDLKLDRARHIAEYSIVGSR